ncbi:MAG: hypothetical protein K6G00_06220 [Treponema sp.]|nr:hypothetical protein [Treponema sp.]
MVITEKEINDTDASKPKKSIRKRLFRFVLAVAIIFCILAFIGYLSDDEEVSPGTAAVRDIQESDLLTAEAKDSALQDSESAEPVQETKQTYSFERHLSDSSLTISDFKLGGSKSNAVKTVKSKEWSPYGWDETGEVLASEWYFQAYHYVKQGGTFDGYQANEILISLDENCNLAEVKVPLAQVFDIRDLSVADSSDYASAFSDYLFAFVNEIEKNCLRQHGYYPDSKYDGKNNNIVIMGYKNEKGDVCKMEISLPAQYTATCTLTYVSGKYIKDVERANNLIYFMYGEQ